MISDTHAIEASGIVMDLDHLSLPPIVEPPSMIGEPWMRSMSANMILFLDAA
jgi:hypothetical protein